MSAKTLKNLHATGNVTPDQRGRVHLYGFATWLRSEPMVEAHMSSREARALAIELLKAAELQDADR